MLNSLVSRAALSICLLQGAALDAAQPSDPQAPQAPEAPEAPAAPEAPEPPAATDVAPFFRDVTRVDAWSFFAPRLPGRDPGYVLLGNRATLGIGVNKRRVHVFGAFQYAQLLGLPRRAAGPNPLGPGALYYDAARTAAAYQLYFKALSLRVNDVAPGLAIEAGRMGFNSGVESRSTSAAIDALKHERLAGRLIGEVGWSTFERAFDGLRVDVDRARWNATAALLWPTQGAFEESANPTLDEIRVASASFTWRNVVRDFSPGTTEPAARGSSLATDSGATNEFQFFAHHYRDRRDITARPDNTVLSPTSADIGIATVGASQVGFHTVGPGRADSLLWVAGQLGEWYGLPHRAVSVIAEGGYRWPVRWRPWVRVGMLYASGDRNPVDARHGTFFPMLPSTKPDLLAGTFAQMNLRDLFAELRLQPHPRVVVSGDLRKMSLVEANDRWYSGTGATARQGSFFGFLTRTSGGANDLGLAANARVELKLTRRWMASAVLGTVKGGNVVRHLFVGDRLTVFSLESVLTLD